MYQEKKSSISRIFCQIWQYLLLVWALVSCVMVLQDTAIDGIKLTLTYEFLNILGIIFIAMNMAGLNFNAFYCTTLTFLLFWYMPSLLHDINAPYTNWKGLLYIFVDINYFAYIALNGRILLAKLVFAAASIAHEDNPFEML